VERGDYFLRRQNRGPNIWKTVGKRTTSCPSRPRPAYKLPGKGGGHDRSSSMPVNGGDLKEFGKEIFFANRSAKDPVMNISWVNNTAPKKEGRPFRLRTQAGTAALKGKSLMRIEVLPSSA